MSILKDINVINDLSLEVIIDKVETVWSFSTNNQGGNAAGICFTEQSLDNNQMQVIAKKVGYSETVFIKIIDSKQIGMRYFTPSEEVPLCGHATIAGFYWLLVNKVISEGEFTLIAGNQYLKVWVEGDCIFMEQPPAHIVPVHSRNLEIVSNLSDQIDMRGQIYTASTGIVDLMLPFKTSDGLEHFIPNFDLISDVCIALGVQGIHAFSKVNESHYVVRNFAPLLGINEESATGTSNCALACLLDMENNGVISYEFSQGMWMQQPSRILTRRLKNGHFSVGGSCRI